MASKSRLSKADADVLLRLVRECRATARASVQEPGFRTQAADDEAHDALVRAVHALVPIEQFQTEARP